MDVNEIIKKCEQELSELDKLEPSVGRTRARLATLRLLRQLATDEQIVARLKSLESRFVRRQEGKFSYLEPEVRDAKTK